MLTTNPAARRERAYWDRNARTYDKSTRVFRSPLVRMCDLIAEELAGADQVLEVGAGTGIATAAAASTVRRVIATDYSEPMVRSLRANVERTGLTNVACLLCDVYALPFRPRSFDAVICANVLHLVPDLPGALEALGSMLRPGGKLVVPTFCHAETRLSRSVSYVLALTGFPGHRRFSSTSLRQEIKSAGLRLERHLTLPGLIPICFASGVFAS